MPSFKFVASQAKRIYLYKNLRNNVQNCCANIYFNRQCLHPLTPNDPYSGRTAPLTSKRSILYIYSTNIDTGYFEHGIHSPIFLFKMQFVS